jgi:hypothetical protein
MKTVTIRCPHDVAQAVADLLNEAEMEVAELNKPEHEVRAEYNERLMVLIGPYASAVPHPGDHLRFIVSKKPMSQVPRVITLS